MEIKSSVSSSSIKMERSFPYDPVLSISHPGFQEAVFRWLESNPPPNEHPDSEKFKKAIQASSNHDSEHAKSPIELNVYRSCSIRYANRNDILSGFGSQIRGGRFNAPRSFRVIYLSLNPNVSYAETIKRAESLKAPALAGLPLKPSQELNKHFIQLTVRAVLIKIINLTDPDLLNSKHFADAGIDIELLTKDGWHVDNNVGKESATQAIGRIAYELGYHGLISPASDAKGEKNLNVFVSNLPIGCGLEILDPEDLPSHWRNSSGDRSPDS
jgi:hypothetical protein